MSLDEDAQYYEAFLHGDHQSFEEIVKKYRDPLVAFLYRYMKDIHLAQDMAQDVFVEVLLYPKRYDQRKSLKAYLFTIGRNKAVDYIRKNKKYVFVDEMEPYDQVIAGLEEYVVSEEEKKILYRRLTNLKLEYQVAITLIDFEELSYAQAAEVMGKSLAQMKVLIHRARKALQKQMEKEGSSNGRVE